MCFKVLIRAESFQENKDNTTEKTSSPVKLTEPELRKQLQNLTEERDMLQQSKDLMTTSYRTQLDALQHEKEVSPWFSVVAITILLPSIKISMRFDHHSDRVTDNATIAVIKLYLILTCK
jgi:hypothetical protein